MPGPDPRVPVTVAVELERLHGTLEARFARVDGALALLVQRSDQTDKQLADMESRLYSLERTRWPVAALAALTAGVGVILGVWDPAGL
ncbi:hypothetical protein [Streptomyces yaizuensis]|uniref:DUF3618 domain-containing protein n=1 Tax=Streptomyces yaizuensis TaxID=2989713 RepID=A0ABQ5P4T6_9ACTN|nr:hypothetical protein [Streptomyces sp. YSPA8]GLF97537.1 hypothetical protein SYYSPA8_24590 [Streptomyces sp. YSPA8]